MGLAWRGCQPKKIVLLSVTLEHWSGRYEGDWSFKHTLGHMTSSACLLHGLCTAVLIDHRCGLQRALTCWIFSSPSGLHQHLWTLKEDFLFCCMSFRVLKPCSYINPLHPTHCLHRGLCQSSQPSSGGQPHGQYGFAQKTETWASPWKENHQSRWFH